MRTFFTFCLGLFLFIAIIFQFRRHSFDDFSAGLIINPGFLLLAFFLMPLNWGLESLKWKLSLKPVTSFSFAESLKSILSGVAVGFITPARVGDYGGRMINLPSEARIPSIAVTFYTSIVQNSIHILGGLIVSYSLINKYWEDFLPEKYAFFLITFFTISGLVLLLNFPKIIFSLIKYIKSEKLNDILNRLTYIKAFDFRFTFKILLLSSLRYMVYLLQYVLIMMSLGVELSFFELTSCIALIYILQSGIPLPPLISFLGRTEIAVLVWSRFFVSPSLALIASVLLWSINLVIPAITGYIIILSNKLSDW